ncbi:MAG: 4Fe-4S dicluster domain-containing protein [Candidatus Omnitrophica bacterium]|nr:4Fe-4S dicluster domain-containing protein [Candidatus Omnitrophota bacterium]
MVKRKIIKIDEEKCNGCGKCVPNCPEGALQIIDGKARLVGELLCDGLGACIGNCPEGAIIVEERQAQEYSERKVIENVVKAGKNTIVAHLKHLKEHGQHDYLRQAQEYMKENNITVVCDDGDKPSLPCGCPGTMTKDFRGKTNETAEEAPTVAIKSELCQWPTQLHLLSPNAPYFQDCDLLIAADCVAFAYANFHKRFLKGKALAMFCPKLDTAMDMYLEKLTAIIRDNNVKSITAVKMEVPCCYGALKLTEEALKKSGKNIVIRECTISIRGEIA